MSHKSEEFTEKIMGGTFVIKCFPQPYINKAELRNKIQEAFNEAKRIEKHLTDFKDSPFNEINYKAGITEVKVDQEIWDIVTYAQNLAKETNGAFDISYAALGSLWRNEVLAKKSHNNQDWEDAKQYVDFKKIVLNQKEKTIYLPSPKMKIGLGGIGKGYAVDSMFIKMIKMGFENFYVNGAGDIRVHSHRDAPRAWRIGIRNPFNKDPKVFAGFIQLKNQACATSGDYVNRIIGADNKNSHHIINPHTGESTNGIVSCTIVAEKTIIADTLATAVIVMGKKKGIEFLNKKKIFGILIDETGKVHLSNKAIEQYQQKE